MMNNNFMNMFNNMLSSNPQANQLWQTAQQMTNGKSPEQIKTIIQNVAKQKGIDINQAQQMFNQFMGRF